MIRSMRPPLKLLLRNLAQSLHPPVAVVKRTQEFQAGGPVAGATW